MSLKTPVSGSLLTHTAPRKLFISDEACKQLIRDAHAHGYLNSYPNARGLSQYVEALMSYSMHDTRPPEVREADGDMLDAGIAPEWQLHSPRLPRMLTLTQHVLTLAAAHCLRLGIAYAPAHRVMGAPTYYDELPCMSALLEAIGSGWVTPYPNPKPEE